MLADRGQHVPRHLLLKRSGYRLVRPHDQLVEAALRDADDPPVGEATVHPMDVRLHHVLVLVVGQPADDACHTPALRSPRMLATSLATNHGSLSILITRMEAPRAGVLKGALR